MQVPAHPDDSWASGRGRCSRRSPSPPAPATTPDDDDGDWAAAPRRPTAGPTTRPATRSSSASPRPAADHGWMGSITAVRPGRGREVRRHRAARRRGHQRRQPADQPGRDLHQRRGRRDRAAAVRRRGDDTESPLKAMEAGIPVINVDREFDDPNAARVTVLGDNYGMGVSAGQLRLRQTEANETDAGRRRDRRHRLAAADPGPQPGLRGRARRVRPERRQPGRRRVHRRVRRGGGGEPAPGRPADRLPLEPRRRPGCRRAWPRSRTPAATSSS